MHRTIQESGEGTVVRCRGYCYIYRYSEQKDKKQAAIIHIKSLSNVTRSGACYVDFLRQMDHAHFNNKSLLPMQRNKIIVRYGLPQKNYYSYAFIM
jgi:hypothetical protein